MNTLPVSTLLGVLAGSLLTAQAAIHGVAIGVNDPPAMLGGFGLIPALPDARAIPGSVHDVDLGYGFFLTFDQAVQHTRVGADWATWSLGYDGDVYYTTLSLDPYSLTLDFGPGVPAVYFYAQPDAFDVVDITAEAGNGVFSALLTQGVDGFGGAAGFGFYGDAGDLIRTIKLSVDPVSGAGGFAVGRFGVVPEGDSLMAAGALSLGLAMLVWRRFRR